MEFEMVQKMKVVSGKKAELVARDFAASENHVLVNKTAEEVESDLRYDYQVKLLLDSQKVKLHRKN